MPPLMFKLAVRTDPAQGDKSKNKEKRRNGNGVMDIVVEKLSEMSEEEKGKRNMQHRF